MGQQGDINGATDSSITNNLGVCIGLANIDTNRSANTKIRSLALTGHSDGTVMHEVLRTQYNVATVGHGYHRAGDDFSSGFTQANIDCQGTRYPSVSTAGTRDRHSQVGMGAVKHQAVRRTTTGTGQIDDNAIKGFLFGLGQFDGGIARDHDEIAGAIC